LTDEGTYASLSRANLERLKAVLVASALLWRVFMEGEFVDKTFWQQVMENESAIPAGYPTAALTAELLAALGSTDPELREGPAYTILAHWIDRGVYAHAELWKMACHLLDNLAIGLGEQETDTVFLRSFSVLILSELVYYDLSHPTLSDAEVSHLFEEVLRYLLAEQDLRGYVPEKGWAHAIAHAADCLWTLARHREITASELERLMEAVAEKLTAPVAHVYLYDEDERLVRAVMAVLQRDLIPLSLLTSWLEQFVHPS
jgi:uncharacterized protein DUF2785